MTFATLAIVAIAAVIAIVMWTRKKKEGYVSKDLVVVEGKVDGEIKYDSESRADYFPVVNYYFLTDPENPEATWNTKRWSLKNYPKYAPILPGGTPIRLLIRRSDGEVMGVLTKFGKKISSSPKGSPTGVIDGRPKTAIPSSTTPYGLVLCNPAPDTYNMAFVGPRGLLVSALVKSKALLIMPTPARMGYMGPFIPVTFTFAPTTGEIQIINDGRAPARTAATAVNKGNFVYGPV